jgi:hypothetical protein
MRMHLCTAVVLTSLVVLPTAVRSGDATQQPATEPPAGATAAPDTWSAVLAHDDVQGVLGKEVRSPTGEYMGRIVDVLVDQTGHVRAAVIDFGGFLGVGSRKVVVDWGALHFSPADHPERITLDLTRKQVSQAPEYKEGKPVVVLGALPSAPEM